MGGGQEVAFSYRPAQLYKSIVPEMRDRLIPTSVSTSQENEHREDKNTHAIDHPRPAHSLDFHLTLNMDT